jgi:hypothetical protein
VLLLLCQVPMAERGCQVCARYVAYIRLRAALILPLAGRVGCLCYRRSVHEAGSRLWWATAKISTDPEAKR